MWLSMLYAGKVDAYIVTQLHWLTVGCPVDIYSKRGQIAMARAGVKKAKVRFDSRPGWNKPGSASHLTSWQKKNASMLGDSCAVAKGGTVSSKLRKKASARQVHQVPAALMLPKTRHKRRAVWWQHGIHTRFCPIFSMNISIVFAFSFLHRCQHFTPLRPVNMSKTRAAQDRARARRKNL